jgi:hypothetical protein
MNKKLYITVNITVEDPACNKEVWMRLQEDVYDAGLTAEFADFYLENPGMSIAEIDREFRDEWDI